MDHNPEVLVHVSAPTTRKTDDLYRSLADAYSTFEPYPQCTGNDAKTAEPEGANTHVHQSVILPTSTTSKDSFGSFPSYVESEDSVVHTSRLGQLERIQAKWRDRRNLRSSLISGSRSSARTPLSSAADHDAFVDNTQQAFQFLESQLLEYLSTTSEDTSEDEADSGVKRVPLMASAGNAQIESQRPQSPREAQISSQPPFIDKNLEANSTTSPQLFQSPVQKEIHATGVTTRSQSASQIPSFSGLPFEVFPPAPKVTVECPGTLPSQATEFLEVLKLQNPGRFKPSTTLRACVPDERGHWSVECSAWSLRYQHEFWSSLCDHIRSGRIGWGITLHREIAQSRGLGTVRLYCWGEIVEHIWLLLWLCSKGKISATGSKWVDAGDIMVIEMP